MSKKLSDQIRKLQKNMSEIPESENVPISDLMNEQFMSNCSSFSSLQELFDIAPFKIETKEDFAAIPDDEWDDFIKSNTTYENWLEMQKAAATARVQATIFKGLK